MSLICLPILQCISSKIEKKCIFGGEQKQLTISHMDLRICTISMRIMTNQKQPLSTLAFRASLSFKQHFPLKGFFFLFARQHRRTAPRLATVH